VGAKKRSGATEVGEARVEEKKNDALGGIAKGRGGKAQTTQPKSNRQVSGQEEKPGAFKRSVRSEVSFVEEASADGGGLARRAARKLLVPEKSGVPTKQKGVLDPRGEKRIDKKERTHGTQSKFGNMARS